MRRSSSDGSGMISVTVPFRCVALHCKPTYLLATTITNAILSVKDARRLFIRPLRRGRYPEMTSCPK